MLNKTIIALTAAVAVGWVLVATDALAAGHPGGHARGGHATGGHAMGGHAMAGYARGGVMVPDTDATTRAVHRSMTATGAGTTTRAAHRSMIAAVTAPTALATVAQATASPLSAA